MQITAFGEVELDFFEEVTDFSVGDAPNSNTPLPGGGSIDDYGTKQTFPGARQRTKSTVVLKSTGQLLQTQINRMKKMRGKRDKLSRIDENGDNQYQWARLVGVNISQVTEETRQTVNKVQSVSLVFVCEADTWLGDFEGVWRLNDGYKLNDDLVLNSGETITLTTSPQSFTVTVAQDSIESKLDVQGPKFTVTAPAGSSFSSVLIESDNGFSVKYIGTVAAGKTLVIDCASSTIENDGSDAYDGLTVIYNASYPNTWFALLVGANEITVTHNGADTIRTEYNEEHI